MQITERQIMRTVHHALDQLPDHASERDSRFAVETANAAIAAMLNAGEPFNKTQKYLEESERIAKTLQSFIEHRQSEQWSADTTYFCATCPQYDRVLSPV